MSTQVRTVRVAAVQAAPVVFDRDATVAKAMTPRGLSFGCVVGNRTMEGRKDWQRYHDQSVPVPGDTTKQLGKAAQEAGVYLVMGVTERDSAEIDSTLYCTTLYFGPAGDLLGKHRKLKPTASERLIWGEGDGSTLTVVDTPYGKMGGLICWENYMPLARTAMYSKGVRIYIAPTADSREVWQSTIRHIALEGRCYVISCNQYVEKSMYPKDLYGYGEFEQQPQIMCSGGTSIVDPLGQYAAEPVYNCEEIVTTRCLRLSHSLAIAPNNQRGAALKDSSPSLLPHLH